MIKKLLAYLRIFWFVIVMGYITPSVAFMQRVILFRKNKGRYMSQLWAECIFRYLHCRVVYNGEEIKKNISQLDRVVILFNHRSWLDFMLAQLALDKPVGQLSRYLVIIIVPIGYLVGRFSPWVFVCFNRGNKNKTKLLKKINSLLDKAFSKTSFFGGYPEGHRNTGPGTLRLKKGFIRYAYERKIPIAFILHTNQDAVINEKKLIIKKNIKVYGQYMGPYYSEGYDDFSSYYQFVCDEFKSGYEALVISMPYTEEK